MRIALNLLYLLPKRVGGTETYAMELVRGLAACDQQNEYVLILNRESAALGFAQAENIRRVVMNVAAVRRPVRYAYEQLYLPWWLKREKVDVVHSLGYVGPIYSSCPSIVSIHDVHFRQLSGTKSNLQRRIVDVFSTRSARNANHILTVSEFSKQQIEQELQVPSDKITVTHLGPGWEVSAPADWEELRGRYKLPDDYIAAFGGGTNHKNIARLVEAFAQIVSRHPHNLVLLGLIPPSAGEAITKAGLRSRLQTLGHVPAADIRPILGHATAFALPSLYEGFGMPLLEAQAAGAPVACSHATSLPEIAGTSVAFFDPLSVTDMARTLDHLLSDPALREQLRQAGYANVRRFSWDKTARETLRVYERVYSVPRARGNGSR